MTTSTLITTMRMRRTIRIVTIIRTIHTKDILMTTQRMGIVKRRITITHTPGRLMQLASTLMAVA